MRFEFWMKTSAYTCPAEHGATFLYISKNWLHSPTLAKTPEGSRIYWTPILKTQEKIIPLNFLALIDQKSWVSLLGSTGIPAHASFFFFSRTCVPDDCTCRRWELVSHLCWGQWDCSSVKYFGSVLVSRGGQYDMTSISDHLFLYLCQ